jgi:hypothetical protein
VTTPARTRVAAPPSQAWRAANPEPMRLPIAAATRAELGTLRERGGQRTPQETARLLDLLTAAVLG